MCSYSHRVRRFTALAVCLLCATSADVHAARSLRVHGAARIDGHAGRSHGKLLLDGRVLDDAGTPVPNVSLTVAIDSMDLSNATTPCGAATTAPPGPPAVRTDESGRYCLWITLPVGAYTVHLEAGPTQWLAKAAADESVDLSKRSVQLRFDPEPRIVSLDAGSATLDAVATYDDADEGAGGAAGLPLALTTETGALVAQATTGPTGRATFEIDGAKLGPPGRGALRVRFDGDATTMASDHAAPVERDAHVSLVLTRRVDASSPEDGVVVEVATSVKPTSPAVATGSVEARLDGVIVGAATLDAAGRAELRSTFVAPREAKTVELQVRYVPGAPWFQPVGELAVTVPIRGPSPLRQLPLAIGALAVAAWLLVGRTARRVRLDRTVVMDRPPVHEGTAGVSVVQSSRGRATLYRGRVVDAHDGTPVARARVSVQVPAFGHADVLLGVFSDDDGEFSFDLATVSASGKNVAAADLVVEAPLHADLRQRLPGAGVLEVALVSRRRRLLERLVQWAKRRGPPFDVRPEPTPGQVRRAAEGDQPVAQWADAVEHAAFDRGDVDARVEADVLALDPDRAPKRGR